MTMQQTHSKTKDNAIGHSPTNHNAIGPTLQPIYLGAGFLPNLSAYGTGINAMPFTVCRRARAGHYSPVTAIRGVRPVPFTLHQK